MKIGIPTDGEKGLEEQICPHFGKASTFTIVDIETNDVTVIPNTSNHMGGTLYPPEVLKGAGAEIMLCGGIGTGAIQMFESFGIAVFSGASGTVGDAVNAWRNNTLQAASMNNACTSHDHDHENGGGCGTH